MAARSRRAAIVAIAMLLAGACTSEGGRDASRSPSTTILAALPSGYVGVWGQEPAAEGEARLTLTPCGVGQRCGRFERIDDNREHCVYPLELGSVEAYGAMLRTGDGNSWGCAYSGWSDGMVLVSLRPDGSIRIALDGMNAAHQLRRVSA